MGLSQSPSDDESVALSELSINNRSKKLGGVKSGGDVTVMSEAILSTPMSHASKSNM